jgi:O-antigen/teichoic acid export membrane protein
VGFLAIQADRLIIASFFSVASVAIYAIITKPYFLLKGLLATSYPVIQPQLSKYNMQQNREDFNDFTSRLIRSSFVLFLSGISFISIFFEEALWIWLRSADYNNHTVWGVLMLLGLGITVLYSPFYRTLFYTDKVKNILNFSFISVSINLLISIILTSYIGFQGVIIGTTTQIILEFFYFNHLAKNELAVNLKMIYTKRLVVATLSIILFSIIIYILKMWYGGSPLILTLIALFTICMLATIIFYFLRVEKIHLLFQRKKEISFQ